jgi:hypothetical protein
MFYEQTDKDQSPRPKIIPVYPFLHQRLRTTMDILGSVASAIALPYGLGDRFEWRVVAAPLRVKGIRCLLAGICSQEP